MISKEDSANIDYTIYIGRKCKKNNKPFKSVISHPLLLIPAFTFIEDDSYVECRRCEIIND